MHLCSFDFTEDEEQQSRVVQRKAYSEVQAVHKSSSSVIALYRVRERPAWGACGLASGGAWLTFARLTRRNVGLRPADCLQR